MGPQSEHLSDAQIEEYTASATPESAATEESRARSDSMEQHLADCSACRDRVLAFERARFALVTDPLVKTALHVDRPGPDCPDEEALRDLAAGLSPPAVASKLTQHAAQCDRCGPLLRMYSEDFSGEATAEEQAVLSQLESASSAWQKKFVQQMIVESGTASATAPRRSFPWRWILAPAALAACAAIAFGVWYSQRETPQKVEKLLAQAYTENRTVEMRVPYAAYADFNQKRSGYRPSQLDLPTSLRRATDDIAKHLKKEPDNPKWLLLSARLDLLDWDYSAALSSMMRIRDAQVVTSPEYLMTLAFAFYEQSEISRESQGYFQAVNLLDKALHKSPADPVLLFNQAIVCEKIHSYECAENDWERLLTAETDPQWSSEARKHLDQIREKKTPAH